MTFSASESILQTEYIINGKRFPHQIIGLAKENNCKDTSELLSAHLKLPVSQAVDVFNVHMIMPSVATPFVYDNREEVVRIFQVIQFTLQEKRT